MEIQYIGAYVLVVVPALIVALGFCRAAARADRQIEQQAALPDRPPMLLLHGSTRLKRSKAKSRRTMMKKLRYGLG